LTILSWHEHLSKDEIPPEYLWEDAQGLEAWWLTVEDKRSDGLPATDRSSERGDSGDETARDGSTGGSGMANNDLARRLKQG